MENKLVKTAGKVYFIAVAVLMYYFLTEIINLIKEILPLLTTDLTDAQILGFAMEAFPLLSELQLKTQQIPGDGAYRMTKIRGMSVIVPNLEKNREILKEIMKTE